MFSILTSFARKLKIINYENSILHSSTSRVVNQIQRAMKIINNKTEYEEFYPYDKKNIKVYPKEFPCVVKHIFADGGLMGDSIETYVAYFPVGVNSDVAFLIGLNGDWKILK